MDENRWPRPGPGMVAVFALIGLIAGAVIGLFSPSGTQQGSQGGAAAGTTSPSSTTLTELPGNFYTVILASIPESRGLREAEARAATFRNAGVENVGVVASSRYGSLSDPYWVVYSGVFTSLEEAVGRRDEIEKAHPGLCNCYAKQVKDPS
jgi:hypothetical protein